MMKQVFKRWFWQLPEFFMILPPVLIIAGLALPRNTVVPFALVLPFHMLIGIGITGFFKKLKNLFITIIGIVYITGITFLWQYTLMSGQWGEIVITVVGTSFFFIVGIIAGIRKNQMDLYFSLGLVIHVVSLLFINQVPVLKPYFSIAATSSIIYVIIVLPLVNRRFLIRETQQKSSLKIIPGTVVRGNIMIVIGTITIIVLLSFWDVLLNAFIMLANGLAWVLVKILDFLAGLFDSSTETPEGGGAPDLGLPPAEESNSIVALILNIIAFLAAAYIVFLLIRAIIRNRKNIYAAIQAFLSRLFTGFRNWSSTEQGYTDRQESLLKTELRKKPSLLKRIMRRKPKWKDMKDNKSRIRFIYSKLVSDKIRGGFNFKSSDTPDETINRINALEKDSTISHDTLKTEYTKVRYGEKEPSDETVKELKQVYIK